MSVCKREILWKRVTSKGLAVLFHRGELYFRVRHENRNGVSLTDANGDRNRSHAGEQTRFCEINSTTTVVFREHTYGLSRR